MKNDNLKRVKGILSAKYGAEVPKFLNSGQLTYAKENFITDTNFQFWCSQNNLPPSQENYIRYQRESSNTGDQKTSDKDITTKKSDFTVEVSPDQGLNKNSAASVSTVQPDVTLAIPGQIPVTPTTSVKEAAATIIREQEAMADLQAQSNARQNAPILLQTQALPQSLNDQDMAKLKKIAEDGAAKADAKNSDKIQQMTMSQDPEFMQQQQKLGQYGEVAAAGFNAVGSAFKANNAANNSKETNAVDSGVSAVSGALSSMGGTAGTVGKIIGIADSAGQIIRGITGGTDQMTGADKFFDSGIGTILGGFINQIGAKKSDPFATDVEALETVGSSYGGTSHDISEAARKADKKYGLFSSGARKKANEAARQVAAIQNTMADVADTARDQRLAVQSMGEQAGIAYSMMADGGYNQKYTYAAKHGGLLEWNPVIELEWQPQIELNWELPAFKEGGSVEFVEELELIPEFKSGGKSEEYPKEYLEFKVSLPDNQRNTSEDDYRTYLYWQLWGKPKNFQYTLEHPDESGNYMYTWDNSDNSYHASTIAWKDGVGYFMKPKHHSTLKYELDWYNKGLITEEGGKQREMTPEEHKEWEEFRSNYELVDDGDFYKYIPKNKKGGSLGDSDIPETEETTQKNVIPEGALHKNKHHMEHAEGLTKKGIPVVDEDGEQQAEIEHSEIIFTLEVTKKLEEYYEIFYSEDSTNKEKEQAALDAGKLLVYQILENTEDRTGLIESCKKGGTLTLKKSTEDLIEEVLEGIPTVVIVETDELEEKKEEKSKKKEVDNSKEELKQIIKEVLSEMLSK